MASINSTNRLTGMFSGMDTDALIKSMVSSQQRKVDLLYQDREIAQWKHETYTELNNRLRIFREDFGSAIGAKSVASKSSFYNSKTDLASNPYLSVTAGSGAKEGSYSVKIDQLASAAAMNGTRATASQSGLSSTVVDKTAIKDITAFSSGIYDNGGNFSFTINGKEFSFDSSDTLKTVMDTVNRSNAGVTMSYSQSTDSFTIKAKSMGEYIDNEKCNITFTDDDGFLNHIGLNSVTGGTNSIISINGGEARTFTDNAITLDGVTFNLLGVTEPGKTVGFNVSRDVSEATDKIKSFVDSFNELVSGLYSAATTKKDYKYSPLTEAQRDELTEKEAGKWDEKAKQGILYRDKNLTKLLDQFREALTAELGENGCLKDIGITVGKYAVKEPFRLEIDAEKLTAALNEDPEKIYNMFTSPASSANKGGLMTRINDAVSDFTNNTKSIALQTLNNNIDSLTKQMKTQNDKIAVMSERYYLQYAKLETALAKMQSQQSQTANMFPTKTS